jgi:hypothetical protein
MGREVFAKGVLFHADLNLHGDAPLDHALAHAHALDLAPEA